jgi:hypothetical protein
MRKFLILLTGILICATPARAQTTTEALLDTLQHTGFLYFWNEANPANGLIKDRSTPGSPSSIAAVGFGLSAICIGIDHGWVSATDGRNRVLTTLQTFWTGPQGSGQNGFIGYKGLFYHFLDMNTATRTWDSELSTIDTALLLAGVLDARQYFSTADPTDVQIRALADSLYYRADWRFMQNFNQGILMGWKPGTGFSSFGQWIGYNEAMILYILALGSPVPFRQVPENAWSAWTSGYRWRTHYGYSYVEFAPLFGHQYSHCWVDFRNISDNYMRTQGINYFENSRRATLAAREYCIDNPLNRVGYSDSLWGLTASDGPTGYSARGAPPGENDDGTITPTAATSSLPFAPEVVIPAIRNMYNTYRPQLWTQYGFRDAFNLGVNWWGPDVLGIDQGPIVLMIENYRNQAVWNRFMQNPDIQRGLERAGFIPYTIGVGDPTGGGGRHELYQNQPNPFSETSLIRYRLASGGRVKLTVYDVRGREVARLVDAEQAAGPYEARLSGRGLANGSYLYRLELDGVPLLEKKCVNLN